MFHRLMSRMAQQSNDSAKIFYRQIFSESGPNHQVLIEMLRPPDAVMKVRVFRLQVYDRHGKSSESKVADPDPKIVRGVMDAFRWTVKDLCTDWMGKRDVSFKLLFECFHEDCKERIPLDHCYEKENAHVGIAHAIKSKDVLSMFGLQETKCDDGEEESPIRYHIYLVASNKEAQEVKNIIEIINRNGWRMTSYADSRLGMLWTKAIAEGLKTSCHVMVIITPEDCETANVKRDTTLAMALQTSRIIPIFCFEDTSILPSCLQCLASMTTANINDGNLEERIRITICSDKQK